MKYMSSAVCIMHLCQMIVSDINAMVILDKLASQFPETWQFPYCNASQCQGYRYWPTPHYSLENAFLITLKGVKENVYWVCYRDLSNEKKKNYLRKKQSCVRKTVIFQRSLKMYVDSQYHALVLQSWSLRSLCESLMWALLLIPVHVQ